MAERVNKGESWIDPSGNAVTVYATFTPNVVAQRLAAGWSKPEASKQDGVITAELPKGKK